MCAVIDFAMHRVGSAGNTSNSTRPRKEKRFTYVLNDSDGTKVNLRFLYIKNSQVSCLLIVVAFFIPMNFLS